MISQAKSISEIRTGFLNLGLLRKQTSRDIIALDAQLENLIAGFTNPNQITPEDKVKAKELETRLKVACDLLCKLDMQKAAILTLCADENPALLSADLW